MNYQYTHTTATDPNAMRLQSVGWVVGTPAQEIKQGDALLWNFGIIYIVNEVSNETNRFIEINTSPLDKPINRYNQRLRKDRLVCILNPTT